MKNIDFKMVFQFLWVFVMAGAFILLARLLNPNGIPDEQSTSEGRFISEAITLLIVLALIFVAAYGLKGAWKKTKEYFKLPLVDKLEKLFIGLFILFNPIWAILSFMYCGVLGNITGDKCGVYSTLTPYLIYLALFLMVMASYFIVLKIKSKSQYESLPEAR